MQVRLLSVQTETPEGGVVVRKSAHVSGKLVKRHAVATGRNADVETIRLKT